LLTSLTISAQTKGECNIEMTEETLFKTTFKDIDCTSLKDKTVTSFKIKVPKYKAVFVKREFFNEQATNNVSKAKIGDTITYFDIKVDTDEKIPVNMIRIVE
jgi:hypothetical protein